MSHTSETKEQAFEALIEKALVGSTIEERKALGITARGELLVETEEGIRTVDSGEVSVRGIYGYV